MEGIGELYDASIYVDWVVYHHYFEFKESSH